MVDVVAIFWGLLCLLLFLIIILSGFLYASSSRFPDILRSEEELYFKDASLLDKKHKFPKISDPPSKTLSVIIPAFDEDIRLPPMLDECLAYLESKSASDPSFSYEVIVVDDGSRDATSDVALGYSREMGCDKFRVLTLVKNRGKGGAVRLGMLSARGELLLFADADGATKFGDYDKLETIMAASRAKDAYSIVVGSRAHLEETSIAQRSIFRTILMHGFHFLVWFFAVKGIRDTQCGFKLLTRDAAKVVFMSLHVERWAFDVEMLYIAQKLGFSISEVGVNWTEIDGSKVTPFWSWLEMGRDLILIWYRYLIGVWAIQVKPKKD